MLGEKVRTVLYTVISLMCNFKRENYRDKACKRLSEMRDYQG